MINDFSDFIDMLIRSGDICDQSQKLSTIAPNFGRYFCCSKFSGAGLPKIVRTLSHLFPGTSPGKVSSVYSH